MTSPYAARSGARSARVTVAGCASRRREFQQHGKCVYFGDESQAGAAEAAAPASAIKHEGRPRQLARAAPATTLPNDYFALKFAFRFST